MNIDIQQLESEMAIWREFLNTTVGTLSFGIALACLSLPHPDVYAFVSLLFLTLVGAVNTRRFPPTVRALRDKKRSDAEDVVYRGIQSKYFGFWPALKTVPLFIVSWSFLGLVAVGLVRP